METPKRSGNYFFFYLRNNIAAALEYRFSFLSQVFGMFINDTLWVIFWAMYFEKFPVLNGWTLNDLLMMWGTITFSFGLCFGFFWNVARLPELVVQGQLDYYLAHPRNVLAHLSVSHIRPVNLGDCLFGPVLLLFFVPMTATQWFMFFLASVLAALIYFAFYLSVGSLAFYLRNAESVTGSVATAIVHFSTYPTRIFDGWTRVMLFTVLPAGFISEVPVELMREFDAWLLGQLVLAAAFYCGLALLIFHQGLKRYESGNLILMQR